MSSHTGTSTVLSIGFLVNPNLETLILDTYRPPPADIPYDANLGRPHTASPNQSIEESNNGISHESTPNISNRSGGHPNISHDPAPYHTNSLDSYHI